MCDEYQSSFEVKCANKVVEYGTMIPAIPGTKAVLRRFENRTPIEEWLVHVVGWIQTRTYGSEDDHRDHRLYVNCFVEPLIASEIGICSMGDYEDNFDGVGCVGFLFPDGSTTDDTSTVKPGTYFSR
jgi:hypothetical protein